MLEVYRKDVGELVFKSCPLGKRRYDQLPLANPKLVVCWWSACFWARRFLPLPYHHGLLDPKLDYKDPIKGRLRYP